MENKIGFKKLYNFRDIGGLQTKSKRKIKSGMLFRSADISRITRSDQYLLQKLDLKLICDLRTVNERKSKMYLYPEAWGTAVRHIPIYHSSQDLTHQDFFRLMVGSSKEINFEEWIHEFYLCIVNERKSEIKQVIEAISMHENIPALIHCTGGKDRTGFISALIQLYLGVPYKTVLAEYLKSNELIKPKMKRTENFIRIASLFQISPEKIKPLLIVEKSYLEGALNQVRTQYGTIEKYFTDGCAIDQQTLVSFKKMMLEK